MSLNIHEAQDNAESQHFEIKLSHFPPTMVDSVFERLRIQMEVAGHKLLYMVQSLYMPYFYIKTLLTRY